MKTKYTVHKGNYSRKHGYKIGELLFEAFPANGFTFDSYKWKRLFSLFNIVVLTISY